jgi:RNA polymerase sporulation-specific sigma factor
MEQPDLLQKAIKGDARSISAIVEQYIPLVQKIVNKYAWMSPAHSREDLVQEGLLGVVRAIETFEIERGTRFMTWVYPQVRGAVQGVARRDLRKPRYMYSIEQSDWGLNLEDTNQFEVQDDYQSNFIHDLIVAGCGSVNSRRAQIVCDRYGLLGRKPMRQGEVAKKYGLTKQATQSYLARFKKLVQEKHPELEAIIK